MLLLFVLEGAQVCEENKNIPLVMIFGLCLPCFIETGSLSRLELAHWSRLTDRQTPRIFLYLPLRAEIINSSHHIFCFFGFLHVGPGN